MYNEVAAKDIIDGAIVLVPLSGQFGLDKRSASD